MPLPQIRELPYCEDSAVYMRALSTFAMPAYLDSAGHGGKYAQQDILTAEPIAYLCVVNGEISCSENASEYLKRSIESSDLCSNIRYLKELFLPESKNDSAATHTVDNCGAVIGYLGYPALLDKATFTVNDAFVGVYRWTLVADHAHKTCTLRFHGSCGADYIGQLTTAVSEALQAAGAGDKGGFRLEGRFEPQSAYADYERAFRDIASRIDRGDCYQVNLTQCFKARGTGQAIEAYLRLRAATTAPFSAYMDWGWGALLSLSPERFLRLRGRDVLTQPVKGTRPRGATVVEDASLARQLAASEKDKAENLMIVDLLRNDLGRVCETGSIEVNQLFKIESYSNVHHMVSDVTGTLRHGLDALDLMASCYPGGSITGAPKLSAMTIIQLVEQARRRLYCGTVFCWGAEGNFDSSITIRSLLWDAGELRCWAGGGIVADSDCAQEYQECFDKVGNIFKALQG